MVVLQACSPILDHFTPLLIVLSLRSCNMYVAEAA